MKRHIVLVVLALSVLSFSSLAQQSPPSADTFVSSATPSTNYGSSIILVVGSGSTTYMKFNLSGVPTGATVSKATLRLFVDAVATGGKFDVYNLPATPTWSESTLNYNTPPPALGTSASGGNATTVSASSMNQFVLINITATVQGWLNTPSSNNGVALALVGTTGLFSFDSKEAIVTSHEPELEIVLNGGGSGTGTVTSVGSGLGLTGGPITTSGTLTIDPTVVPQLGAANNLFAGNISALSFSGNGAGLTNLNTNSLTGGSLPGSALAGTYGNALTFSNPANSFTGNGAGLTNVNAASLNGAPAANIPSLATSNNFVGNQTITGNLTISGVGSTLTVGGPSVFNMDVTSGAAITSNCLASAGATCTGFQFNGLTGNTILNAQINGTPELNVDAGGDMTLNGALTSAGATLPPLGTATSSVGFNSNALNLVGSSFNGTGAQIEQFILQTEPVNNGGSSASGTLNLLFQQGSDPGTETGLSINQDGTINFVSSQVFGMTTSTANAASSVANAASSVANAASSVANAASSAANGASSAATAASSEADAASSRATAAASAATSAAAQASAALSSAENAQGTANNDVPVAGGTMTGPLNIAPANSLTVGGTQLVLTGGNVGVGTATPQATLDVEAPGPGGSPAVNFGSAANPATFTVNGSTNLSGSVQIPSMGTATSSTGYGSNWLGLNASSYNGSAAVNQQFVWQAQPTGNGTSGASGQLSLLFGSGSVSPAATGLSINDQGIITFASGQTFGGGGGSGTGTVTSVATVNGGGLTASPNPIINQGTISIATGGVTNSMLATPSLTIAAGTGLSGGGTVQLGGTTTLNLDTSNLAQLNVANTFAAEQTISTGTGTSLLTSGSIQTAGSLIATVGVSGGTVSAQNSYSLGGFTMLTTNLTAGTTNDLFLGYSAGTTSASAFGSNNIGLGNNTLTSLSGGADNTAVGFKALADTGGGSNNTGVGNSAIYSNAGGSYNTGVGEIALYYNTSGSYNTALGYSAGPGSSFTGLSYATAIGAGAVVNESNALVLGGTGTSAVTVGIGTATPSNAYLLDVESPASGPNGVYINGNLNVTGSITGATKNFTIDHPLDPANKYLVHASVESSEMMNIYTGNVTTDDEGEATVQLPDWFEALNTDFRYQLTVIGQFAQAIVAREIQNHQFVIRTNAPNVKVSWQVAGVRQDAYAKAHPLVVEQEKSARERASHVPADQQAAPKE